MTHRSLTTHDKYMQRCLELAKLGKGNVAPNPMVGALLVYDDRIIGEGYHQKHGEAHAEGNCIESVKESDRHLISQSVLYVSLEPCAHWGMTPPCADLIIRQKIPRVIIGCRDPFKEVNGKGIEKLKGAGIEVEVAMERECVELNKRFFTFHIHHRPYIILKWAQTENGRIAPAPSAPSSSPDGGEPNAQASLAPSSSPDGGESNAQASLAPSSSPDGGERSGRTPSELGASRLFISNDFTNRLVHKWRSEEAAILVGTNTALLDDPELTTRLWKGNNPFRMVVDLELALPSSLKIFNEKAKTIVFNTIKHEQGDNILYYQVTADTSIVHQIVNALYQLKIQSVIVEGGARLLQSFIDEGMWDEARVITNEQLIIDGGLHAPGLSNQRLLESQTVFSDKIRTYQNSLMPPLLQG